MCDNTRHPSNPALPWSFKKHEYQIAIATDPTPHIAVRKCTQIGVSELLVRMVLALMNLLNGTNWIYVLPALGFARKFSTSRIIPVIQASPVLRTLLAKEPDSAEMRRMGDSFLFMAGCQSQRQAISIPARGVIRDEYDFMNQTVATSFMSRLGHNPEEEKILLDFSSPTVPGYGISALEEEGTQRVYLCRHDACGQWTVVEPLHDIVVPGFDEELVNLEKADLDNPFVRVDDTWVRCQQCHRSISQQNLADPEKRAWVPKYPGRKISSYYVSPLDSAAIRRPAAIVRGIKDYERTADWVNFEMGSAYQSSENSILPSALEHSSTLSEYLPPADRAALGTLIGVDVGKTSNLVTIKSAGRYIDVLWLERIRQGNENELGDTVVKRLRQYGALRGVIDSAPDITVPNYIIGKTAYHQMWAAYFARKSKSSTSNLEPDEVTQMIRVARTEVIDELVKKVNGGYFRFPKRHAEYEIFRNHLLAMKRVTRISETGERTAAWVSTGDDHYFFALLYAYVAKLMIEHESTILPLPVAYGVSKVRVGGGVKK